MGASMKVFVIVTDRMDRQTEDRLFSTMWRVAYFISYCDVGNGYFEYVYGCQFGIDREFLKGLLIINNIPFFSIE